MKLINLNKTLTKDQKKMLFNIIRNTIMKVMPDFTERRGSIRDEKGDFIGHFWTSKIENYFFNNFQDFEVNYNDNCISLTIHRKSLIGCWMGGG
jgi:hypothetical protein